jgi:hypothetical protein
MHANRNALSFSTVALALALAAPFVACSSDVDGGTTEQLANCQDVADWTCDDLTSLLAPK